MQSIVSQAGWPIWFLIILSVAMVAICIERFLSLRTERIAPSSLAATMLQTLRTSNDHAATLAKMAAASPLGAVLVETYKRSDLPPSQRRLAIEDVGRVQAHHLNRYLPLLSLIASIAPLMGLFGTVVGMIEIFGSYRPDGTDPTQLARGISTALYNTGFGIVIAVPAMMAHRYFKSRVASLLIQMEQASRQLNDAISSGSRG